MKCTAASNLANERLFLIFFKDSALFIPKAILFLFLSNQHFVKMMKQAIIALGILLADVGHCGPFVQFEEMTKSWAGTTGCINAVQWADHVDMMIQHINEAISDHAASHSAAPTIA